MGTVSVSDSLAFNMKFLIVLVAFAALALADELKLTDEQKALSLQRARECTQQEGITKAQAQALRAGNFEDTDPKVKCFANCFLEKTGFIADGQIKPEAVLNKLGPIVGVEKVKEIQSKCDSIKGADKCDTAHKLYQCYYKQHAQI